MIALVGHASVIDATVMDVDLATQLNVPVYSGIIVWTLSAVADSI